MERVYRLSQEQREAVVEHGYCVVDPCVPPEEVNALARECALLARGVDLYETDCVVDLWAPVPLSDDDPARTRHSSYLARRAAAVAAARCSARSDEVDDVPAPGKEKDIADRKRRKVGTIEVQKQWDAEDCPPKDLTATDEDAITRCIFQRCIAPLQLHKLLQLCQTFTLATDGSCIRAALRPSQATRWTHSYDL
jgi:hypothetical protein